MEKGITRDSITAVVARGKGDRPPLGSASCTQALCAYPKEAALEIGGTELESAFQCGCE